MTILLQGDGPERLDEWPLMVPQNCHPDRSVAQWRDLRFLFRFYGAAAVRCFQCDHTNQTMAASSTASTPK
jgi:hypothetical protein